MTKIKTFIFISNFSSKEIDEIINNFMETEKIKLIDIKIVSIPRDRGHDEVIYTLVYETQQ